MGGGDRTFHHKYSINRHFKSDECRIVGLLPLKRIFQEFLKGIRTGKAQRISTNVEVQHNQHAAESLVVASHYLAKPPPPY